MAPILRTCIFALSLVTVVFAQQESTPPPAPVTAPHPDHKVHTQITAPDENTVSVVPRAPAPPRIVEIPLLDCSGLPCVAMTTGSGKTLKLLLDTGNPNSYLDIKVAQGLGVDMQGLKGNSDASTSPVQQTVVPGAKLGDLPMGDFPFMVLDTTPDPTVNPKEKLSPLPADGALTYNAFQNRLVQIDFAGKLVRISEPEDAPAPCPHACSELVRKHFGDYGPVTLTAKGFTVDNQPVDAQIDTLFTGTMLVYPSSVEKLGLKKQAKSKQKEFFPFTQNGLRLARFDGASEAFRDVPLLSDAPLYFMTNDDHPPAVSFDVTVGIGLLSHAVVTFDFKGMHMWLDSNVASAAR